MGRWIDQKLLGLPLLPPLIPSNTSPFLHHTLQQQQTQAVFRAPDLSSSFVEAMDAVVNQLLKVKDQELIDMIAEIAREVCNCMCRQGRVGKGREG